MDSLVSLLNDLQPTFSFEGFVLHFKKPSGTSRGILTEKLGWKLFAQSNSTVGLGECSVIPELSPDFSSIENYEALLTDWCHDPIHFLKNHSIQNYPSLLFAIESALNDLRLGGDRIYFDSFKPNHSNIEIPINGLVWMGDYTAMHAQIQEKLQTGFSCVKLKVGAIDFDTELKLIEEIRLNYSAQEILIRVDANGAFDEKEALFKLERLANLEVHSIEQPIRAGNWKAMGELCKKTPLPIALDEELIGINDSRIKEELLDRICPQFIILKPSLHGGISGTQDWIQRAENRSVAWWMTSALESNIGLNVIAQLTHTYHPEIPQGLGTGGLYETNFESHWEIANGHLIWNR